MYIKRLKQVKDIILADPRNAIMAEYHADIVALGDFEEPGTNRMFKSSVKPGKKAKDYGTAHCIAICTVK